MKIEGFETRKAGKVFVHECRIDHVIVRALQREGEDCIQGIQVVRETPYAPISEEAEWLNWLDPTRDRGFAGVVNRELDKIKEEARETIQEFEEKNGRIY